MGDGVSWFDTATAHVAVHFPEGKRACKWCYLFCKFERDYNRYSCKITGEWLEDIGRGIGRACPLEFGGCGNEHL